MGQVSANASGVGVLSEPLLSVRDLSVAFAESDGTVLPAVDRVSFDVRAGEVLGIVGESGCGKSVTLRSLIGLQLPGCVIGGQALFKNGDLLAQEKEELAGVRGSEIGMIFQDAGSALSPVLSIGSQLTELLRVKRKLSRRDATTEAVSLLARVGIPSATRRMRDYPHQLSGGMRQRVMIALAVAPRPPLLLADEPTTALDVTVQDQVLTLLSDLRQEENMAMILVSHDLSVVGQECDSLAVMYAGRVVEYGAVADVLDSPRHPCTEALMASTLPAEPTADRSRLPSIEGQPPELAELPTGCSFRPRCRYGDERCASASMVLDRAVPEHGSACIAAERVGK